MSDNENQPVNPQQPADQGSESAQQSGETARPETTGWQAPAEQQPQQPRPRYGEYAPQQPAHPAQQQPTAQYPQGYQHTQQTQHNQHTQPTDSYSQHPYYAQFSAPGQPNAQGRPQSDRPKGDRTLTGKSIGLIVAALVVGGLLGGGVGGGIAAVVDDGSGKPVSISNGGSGASNITVNNPKSATEVTAVAAKNSNSVVTINVSASQESGTGSGVILTSDGYILTNTHVVTLDGDAANGQIQVQTNDGKLYGATVVGTDPTDDLAVIKLKDASGLNPISWGDSSKLNVGDQVVAIGAPLGLQGTVTDGIVSALNRSVSLESSAPKSGGNGGDQNPFGGFGGSNPFDPGQQSSTDNTISVPAIQTDAAINPGNSGGALLNSNGELVGINVAIASTGSSDGSGQSGNIGVGFAIPSEVAHRIANELKDNGKATHGLLGAMVSNAAAQDTATTVGARIESVTSGGAADDAGLKGGDVVTNVDGVPITQANDLSAQVRAKAAGAKIKITYVRDGKTYQTDAKLGSYTPKS